MLEISLLEMINYDFGMTELQPLYFVLNKEFKEYCDIRLECISKTACRQGHLKSHVLDLREIFKEI